MPAPLTTTLLVLAFLVVFAGAPAFVAFILGGCGLVLELMIAGGDPPV